MLKLIINKEKNESTIVEQFTTVTPKGQRVAVTRVRETERIPEVEWKRPKRKK